MPKTDAIAFALERVSESAHSLAVHGAGGYSIDTGALDAVLLRCLMALREAMIDDLDESIEYFDPYGDIYMTLSVGLGDNSGL